MNSVIRLILFVSGMFTLAFGAGNDIHFHVLSGSFKTDASGPTMLGCSKDSCFVINDAPTSSDVSRVIRWSPSLSRQALIDILKKGNPVQCVNSLYTSGDTLKILYSRNNWMGKLQSQSASDVVDDSVSVDLRILSKKELARVVKVIQMRNRTSPQ